MPHVKNAENRDSTLIRKTKRRVDESPRLGVPVDVEVALSVGDDADGEPVEDVGEDIEIGYPSLMTHDSVMGVFLYWQIWDPWHCATTNA